MVHGICTLYIWRRCVASRLYCFTTNHLTHFYFTVTVFNDGHFAQRIRPRSRGAHPCEATSITMPPMRGRRGGMGQNRPAGAFGPLPTRRPRTPLAPTSLTPTQPRLTGVVMLGEPVFLTLPDYAHSFFNTAGCFCALVR